MKIRTTKAWADVDDDGTPFIMDMVSFNVTGDKKPVVVVRNADWRKIAKHLKKYPMEDSDD